MQKIRVTETKIVEYIPMLDEDEFYTNNGIKTIEDAAVADETCYKAGELDLESIGEVSISSVWEVIDESE